MKIIKIERKKTAKEENQPEKKISKRINPEKYSKYLQENAPECEKVLRDKLKEKGYEFLFNELLHGYIPDFYFPAQKKIIELDGKRFHGDTRQKEYDQRRDRYFRTHYIETLRLASASVHRNLSRIILKIDQFLYPNHRRPLRKRKMTSRQRRRDEIFKRTGRKMKGTVENYRKFVKKS